MAELSGIRDWEAIRARFDALWRCEVVDRCCCAVSSWKDGLAEADFAPVEPLRKDDPADLADWYENPDRILRRNLRYMDLVHWAGDSFPVLIHSFAPAGHAEYFGARSRYGEGTVWLDPSITDLEAQFPVYDPDHPALRKHLAIARTLAERTRGRCLVAMPDTVGAADALSHLMGPEAFLIEIAERPELVARAISAVNDGWRDVSERFYQAVKDDAGGTSVGWLGTWGRGRHHQMQCDLSVMLSPKDYERLLLPELERQMDWIEYPLYHLDGMGQLRHLDLLLSLPRLRMIQWTNVVGQPPASAFLPEFRRIQAAGKALHLGLTKAELPAVMEGLSSEGLFLTLGADSEAEAEEIVAYIAEHTHA
jgi:hypothetical protein